VLFSLLLLMLLLMLLLLLLLAMMIMTIVLMAIKVLIKETLRQVWDLKNAARHRQSMIISPSPNFPATPKARIEL
jgi:hypothetical protein